MAKVAFVQNLAFEYLGTMCLSSILKRGGHEVQVFIGNNPLKIASEIKDFGADLAGFYCTTNSYPWCLKASGVIRGRTGVKSIFGGPHPTFMPEIIEKDEVDIVCRGEAEHSFLELVNRLDKGRPVTDISNCWFKEDNEIIKNDIRPFIEDLDVLPFFDREIYYEKYPFLNSSQKLFMAGRGCPFKCSYCFNESMQELYANKGKYVRYRSVENVLSEMKSVLKAYGIRTVYMVDDTFIINSSWVEEFLDRYVKEINLPFLCLVRIDLLTEKLAKKLKRANCYSVLYGIESGNEKLRTQILNKRITNEQIIEGAYLLKRYGIRSRVYNMVGIPGETIEDALETVRINIKIKADYPWCALLQPYPKTKIEEYSRSKNILETTDKSSASSFFRGTNIISKDSRELVNLQKLFYFAVKLPFLLPLIKILIKLPQNALFNLIFLAGYAYSYRKALNLKYAEFIKIGIRNLKMYR